MNRSPGRSTEAKAARRAGRGGAPVPPSRLACAAVMALLALFLCGCFESRGAAGAQCDRNTDCQTPFVCRLARCRVECGTTRDCPIGSLCVRDHAGLGACLLPDEATCSADECPAPLRCIAGACTEQCSADRDCAPGAICEGEAGARGCRDPSGAACVTSRECPSGMRCTADGRCRPPCRHHRDCRTGMECVLGTCTPIDRKTDAGIDAAMGDASVEAGADGGRLDATTDGGSDGAVDGGVGAECRTPADCTAAHVAMTGCVAGRCAVVTCDPGFGDCDGAFATGCELDVSADPDNCGLCGGRCGLGGACSTGRCDTVVGVSLGLTHLCVTRSSGVMLCAGKNDYGELGRGTRDTAAQPFAQVMMLADASAADPGAGTTCALRNRGGTGGGVACMGNDDFGQLGIGSTTSASLPADVLGLVDAIAISAGGDHVRVGGRDTGSLLSPIQTGFTCALRAGGAVSCWGAALYRGDAATTPSSVPVTVPGLTDAVDLAAGHKHVCAVRAGGGVVCWGRTGPRLGPMGSADRNVPVPVASVSDALRIDAAAIHTCVVRRTGGVSCWGAGPSGQLGTSATMSATPVDVMGITDAVDIDVGEFHSCALRAGGGVRCWGTNLRGELGDGTPGPGGFTPVDVAGLTDAVAISASRLGTCALRRDGAIACWGGQAQDYGVAGGITSWTRATEHPDFPPTPIP